MKSSRHSFLTALIVKQSALVALLSVLAPLSSHGANVVVDPGFELIPAGNVTDNGGFAQWANYNDTAGNIVIQSTIFHSGIQALQLNTVTTGTQGFGIVYQNTSTTLTPSQVENITWNYSFWVYTPGGAGSFTYEFISSNGDNVNQPGATGVITASSLAANTWTEVSGTFTTLDATPDSDRLKANFYSFNGTGTSSFYIDDVSLSAVPEPAALGLLALAPLLALSRRRA